MKRIKVLHLILDLDVAGAQTVVMDYLRSFQNDSEVEVYLLVLGKNTNNVYNQECKRRGYNVIYCNNKCSTKIPVLRTIITFITLFTKIRKVIKDIQPEIIHSHLTTILPFLFLPYLFTNVKFRFHTLHSDPYAIPMYFVLWARFFFHVLKVKPICVTESQALKAQKRYKLDQIIVIHNGMNFNKYTIKETKEEIRTSLGLSHSSFIIGCVARLDKIKNFDFLLKVFFEFKKINQNSILLLVGEGPERARITDICGQYNLSDSVILLGQRMDVERIYKSMDVFMLTSFFESSSIVTVEAQLSGLRCVISDRIPRNVIISSKVNRLPLEDSINRWVDALSDKLSKEEIYSDKEDYDLSQTISKLKRLYKSSLSTFS